MSFSTKDVLRDDHVKGSHLLSLPASKGENGQAIEECDIDGMFKFIGEIGKYQIGVNLIMSLFIIAPTYQSLMLVFVGYSPSWKCSRAGNISGACNISGDVSEGMPNFNERCSMDAIYWEYAVPIDYSIVSQFGLVCDRSALAYIASSAYFLGGIVGSPILGWCSDRFGRLKTLLIAYVIVITTAALSALSPNVWIFILCRIFVGSCYTASMVMITLATEAVGPSYRALLSVLPWYAYTLGLCLLSLQAYFVHSWTHLILVTTVPYIILVIPFRLYPDSIRWLRIQKGPEASMLVIREIARWNKRTIPATVKLLPASKDDVIIPSIKDVLWPWIMLRRTILQSVIKLENGLVYYGMSLATSSLSGNLHRDFFYLGIVEVFSYALTPMYANRVGRRIGTLSCMLATGVLLALVGILPLTGIEGYNTGRIVLGILAKLTTTTAYNVIGLWSFELYPTSVRCTAVAVGEIAGLCGSVLAPWVALWLGTFYPDLPYFTMAGIAAACSLACLLLPETNGCPTMEIFASTALDNGDPSMELVDANEFNKEKRRISAAEEV